MTIPPPISIEKYLIHIAEGENTIPSKTNLPQEIVFKALIVEDNASFRQSFKEALQSRFPLMVIEEAADGNETLQKIDAFLPHLVFMDIQLPGENGLYLTKKVKMNYPGIFIMILTSQNSPEYREAAFQAGANHFMAKDSLNWEEIETLVNSISLDFQNLA